jgi:hypothetical protein
MGHRAQNSYTGSLDRIINVHLKYFVQRVVINGSAYTKPLEKARLLISFGQVTSLISTPRSSFAHSPVFRIIVHTCAIASPN